MKKLLWVWLMSLIYFATYSQDLIVTNDNDSINCKIEKMADQKIYYLYKKNKVSLPKDDIKSYAIGFYKDNPELLNHKRFMLSAYAGYSRLTAPNADHIHNSLNSYYAELKKSEHFAFDFKYYTKRKWSIGVFYNHFSTYNSKKNVVFIDTNNVSRIGYLSDDIKINYIGVTASKAFDLVSFISFEPYFSMGHISYRNDLYMIDKYVIKGSTFGLDLGALLNIKIIDNLYISCNLSYKMGGIRTYSVLDEDGNKSAHSTPDGTAEGLQRIDIAGGLRFAF